MILFFYHSLLPFGGTDLKMTMMTKSNYLHWICILETSVKCIQWQATFPRFVEKYCMSSQIYLYIVWPLYISIHKSIHGPDHSSLWFFYFHRKAFADCIVLESEFRHVQRQYLWNDDYKILTMKKKKKNCLCLWFLLSFFRNALMELKLQYFYRYFGLLCWYYYFYM